MKFTALIACICLATPALLTTAVWSGSGTAMEPAGTTVNTMCPIGKEPIVPSAGTVEYKGRTIGLCCKGCGEEFLAWNVSAKDEFLALSVAGREPGTQDHAGSKAGSGMQATVPAAAKPAAAAPYPLDICPISGGKLGSMGDPIIKQYNGREVRFCCAHCVPKFEANPEAAWKKVDAAIIKDQLPHYPLTTCVVSGEPLFENGKDVAISVVQANRLFRLCCDMCEKAVKADPAKFTARLDQAAADAQRADYPLTTCIVSGGQLGSMGEPTEMVLGGRLLRFCCANCEPKALADPAKFISKIDQARAAAVKD